MFFFIRSSVLKILLCSALCLTALLAQKVTYKADKIQLNPKNNLVILTGNAFVRNKQQGLQADKIILDNKKNIAEAFGRVRFLNREQKILYKGGYLKYLIKEERVEARDNSSIENKADKTFIYADAFVGEMKQNLINTTGNTRIVMDEDTTNEMIATSERSTYNTVSKALFLSGSAEVTMQERVARANTITLNREKKEIKLNEQVFITEKTVDEAGKLQQFDVSCQDATFFSEEKKLLCLTEVVAKNPDENSYLTAEELLYESESKIATVRDQARFIQRTPTNFVAVGANFIKLNRNTSFVFLSNEVLLQDFDPKTEELVMEVECQYAESSYGAGSYFECFQSSRLNNLKENAILTADFLRYDYSKRTGQARGIPVLEILDPTNHLFAYSKRMDLDRSENKIFLYEDVLIEQRDRAQDSRVENTIACERAQFNYETPREEVFECFNKVKIVNLEEKITVTGGYLRHSIKTDHSYLEKEVFFLQAKDGTNRLSGVSKTIDSYRNQNYIEFNDEVDIIHTKNEVVENTLKAQRVRYHFEKTTNAAPSTSSGAAAGLAQQKESLEGFGAVVVENPKEASKIFAEYVSYYPEEKTAYATGDPLFVSEGPTNNTLVFAEEMVVEQASEKARLEREVLIFRQPNYWALSRERPSLAAFPQNNYLSCEQGVYDYRAQQTLFECFRQVTVKDLSNRVEITAQHLEYNLDTERAFFDRDPVLVQADPTNTITVTAVAMEFLSATSEANFYTNVKMTQKSATNGIVKSRVSCQVANYSYSKTEQTLRCENEVFIEDLEDRSTVTAQYAEHRINSKYSLVTGAPQFRWQNGAEFTTVKADVFERFDADQIMQAKGAVEVDNGRNQAFSSIGVYDLIARKITLFGAPRIRNRQGNEFSSEQVVFDLNTNTMELEAGVSGSLLPGSGDSLLE